MIVGFTGSRHGMTPSQTRVIALILADRNIDTVHHGDCIGADEQFHALAMDEDIDIEQHPPSSDKWRAFCKGGIIHDPKPYHERNRAIVDACDLLLACPKEYQDPGHGGTWYTIRQARKAHVSYTVVHPDGSKDTYRFSKEERRGTRP